MENPCAYRARRDSTADSALPTYLDLDPKFIGVLPNLKRLASKYANREEWLTFDDALQTLLLGAHTALQKLDRTLTVREQGRYIVVRSENFLKTRIDLDAHVSCPSHVTGARNRARDGSGSEEDHQAAGFLSFKRICFSDFEDGCQACQCSSLDDIEGEALERWSLAQLPELDAAVFELVRLLQFSYGEAASILGISVDRVQSRLNAACKRLADMFADSM